MDSISERPPVQVAPKLSCRYRATAKILEWAPHVTRAGVRSQLEQARAANLLSKIARHEIVDDSILGAIEKDDFIDLLDR